MRNAILMILTVAILGHNGAGDHIHGGAGSKTVVMTTTSKGR
jgi:hypothetical protein